MLRARSRTIQSALEGEDVEEMTTDPPDEMRGRIDMGVTTEAEESQIRGLREETTTGVIVTETEGMIEGTIVMTPETEKPGGTKTETETGETTELTAHMAETTTGIPVAATGATVTEDLAQDQATAGDQGLLSATRAHLNQDRLPKKDEQ